MPRPPHIAGHDESLVTTDIERAAAALRAGGLVAIPTETVYGLAADASDPTAVRRIFEVKGRPAGHPLIVHISGAQALDDWASNASASARLLADSAWPGPLTLIVPKADSVPAAVTGGRVSVGLRSPAHPLAHELLVTTGLGVAAPSANRFGAVSPTTAEHVLHDLGDVLDPQRDCILDGGACPIGVESTIVDTTVEPPQLLRSGAIAADDIDALLASFGSFVAGAAGPARASGMLTSHYAPSCEVRLVDSADDAFALRAATPGAVILNRSSDLAEYAQHLYADLRAADEAGATMVIAVLPPAEGLGHALRDRLTKSAAPRPR